MPQTHIDEALLLSYTAGGRSMLRPYSLHQPFFIGHFYFDTSSILYTIVQPPFLSAASHFSISLGLMTNFAKLPSEKAYM